MKGWSWLAAAAVAAFGAAAAAQIVRAPVDASDPAAAMPGAAIYGNMCAGCHGPGGKGAEAPSLIDPIWLHGDDDASISRSITQGFPPRMPPFALPEGEVKAMIAYLRARNPGGGNAEVVSSLSRGAMAPPTGVVHSQAADFRVETVARLDHPYGFAFLPDGRILVTETAGVIRIVDKGRLAPEPVGGVPLGERPRDFFKRRLLNIAVHPDYATNGWIYLTTTEYARGQDRDQVLMKLVRGRIRDNRWTDHQVLLEALNDNTSTAKIAFDRHGYLFLTIGNSANVYEGPLEDAPAQDLAVVNGKVLRMHDDGRAPTDNPFVNVKGASPFVWSYGHREPLGLAFDAGGRLWEAEDGQRGGDEVNIVRKGANYGWPVITWGHRYDTKPSHQTPERDGMEQPVLAWVPSPAVSGIGFYTGDAIPQWKGDLFVGTLKKRTLYRIVLDGEQEVAREQLLRDLDRFRDMATGPDGHLYVLTEGGLLLRLVPAAPVRRAQAKAAARR